MATLLLIDQLGLKPHQAQKTFKRAATEQHVGALGDPFAELRHRIENETVTLEHVDSALEQASEIPPATREYLLSVKAGLLFEQDKIDEALRYYDEAIKTKEEPSTWALKGNALLLLERVEEAIGAYQQSYSLRETFGPQKEEYLADLFLVWSGSSLLWCLQGILKQDPKISKSGVDEYLAVVDKARIEGLDSAIIKPIAEAELDSIPEDFRHAVEELEVMVRLLSIKDPFEGWRALTKEMTKVWPEGLSAVDAIREQRDREWNT